MLLFTLLIMAGVNVGIVRDLVTHPGGLGWIQGIIGPAAVVLCGGLLGWSIRGQSHEHKWKLIVEKTIPPAVTVQNLIGPGSSQLGGAGLGLMSSTYITILACKKCGELDKTITRSIP
jgi:hypothetical protein